jgi:hypothetical protein
MSKKHHSKKDNLDIIENTHELNSEIEDTVEEKEEEQIKNHIEESEKQEISTELQSKAIEEINHNVFKESIEISMKEPFYAIDEIEKNILHATKIGNHHLASELHKVNALLSDLNHTFAHLSGEAKLVVSVILKNGKILKC